MLCKLRFVTVIWYIYICIYCKMITTIVIRLTYNHLTYYNLFLFFFIFCGPAPLLYAKCSPYSIITIIIFLSPPPFRLMFIRSPSNSNEIISLFCSKPSRPSCSHLETNPKHLLRPASFSWVSPWLLLGWLPTNLTFCASASASLALSSFLERLKIFPIPMALVSSLALLLIFAWLVLLLLLYADGCHLISKAFLDHSP